MTLEQNHILEKIPTRKELMEDVLRLQQVSEVLSELLARRMGPVEDPVKLNELISECIGEQTRIVDKFLALSDDQGKKASLNNLITAIEDQTRLMEGCSDEQEERRLRDDIHGYIDEWIDELEKIIAGVVESLPAQEEIPPQPVLDEEGNAEEGAGEQEAPTEGQELPAGQRISYREQGYAEEPGFAEETTDAQEIVITEQDGHFDGKA